VLRWTFESLVVWMPSPSFRVDEFSAIWLFLLTEMPSPPLLEALFWTTVQPLPVERPLAPFRGERAPPDRREAAHRGTAVLVLTRDQVSRRRRPVPATNALDVPLPPLRSTRTFRISAPPLTCTDQRPFSLKLMSSTRAASPFAAKPWSAKPRSVPLRTAMPSLFAAQIPSPVPAPQTRL
jgi:hypothetical protein